MQSPTIITKSLFQDPKVIILYNILQLSPKSYTNSQCHLLYPKLHPNLQPQQLYPKFSSYPPKPYAMFQYHSIQSPFLMTKTLSNLQKPFLIPKTLPMYICSSVNMCVDFPSALMPCLDTTTFYFC